MSSDFAALNDLVVKYRSLGDLSDPSSAPQQDLADVAGKVEAAYLSGASYDPLFSYTPSEPSFEYESLRREALLLAGSSPVAALFSGFLGRQFRYASAVRSGSADEITQFSLESFGRPSAGLLSYATSILADAPAAPVSDAPLFPDTLAAAALSSVLPLVGAFGWEVSLRASMIPRMSVSPAKKTVFIRLGEFFTAAEVSRLAVHEVATHVLRSVSGSAQPCSVFALGVAADHLLCEEGLAVWLEDQAGVLSGADLRKYALRVLAADKALSLGFSGVYAYLRGFTDPHAAFAITLRAKRGIADTSLPGAYVKDAVYLGGLLACRDALVGAPDETLRLLWGGKVSLSMLPLVSQLAHEGEFIPASFSPLDLPEVVLPAVLEFLR